MPEPEPIELRQPCETCGANAWRRVASGEGGSDAFDCTVCGSRSPVRARSDRLGARSSEPE